MKEPRLRKPTKPYMTAPLLIEKVKEHEVLWNEGHKLFRNRDLRRSLWNKVASSFVGGSPHDMQQTWENLRKGLNNHRNAYNKKYGASGSAAVPYQPYKWESCLSFLDGLSYVNVDKMEGNLHDDLSGEGDEADNSCEEDDSVMEEDDKENGINRLNVDRVLHFSSSRKPLSQIHSNFQSPSKVELSPNCGSPVNVIPPSRIAVTLKDPVKDESVIQQRGPKKPHEEAPALRRDRLRRERNEAKAQKRESVRQELDNEVRKAKLNQHREGLGSPGTTRPSDISSALEDALLKELQKGTDDAASAFLMSLVDGVRLLPKLSFRQFQMKTINLLLELEEEALKLKPEQDQVARSKEEGGGQFQLSPDRLRIVDAILKVGNDMEVTSIQGVTLYGRDFQTLDDTHWLNDNIINVYMSLINKKVHGCRLSAYAFNTFFLVKLMSPNGGYESVKSWGRKGEFCDDVEDVLLIPVHRPGHWALICINKVDRVITYCDSLGQQQEFEAGISAVEKYLVEKTKISNWTHRVSSEMPLQANGFDCGAFICQYAKRLALGSRETFGQEDMPALRKCMAFEIFRHELL